MLIREYTPADLQALRALHASQGFEYAFPDLADPLFVSKLLLEDTHAQSQMCHPERSEAERGITASTSTAVDPDGAIPRTTKTAALGMTEYSTAPRIAAAVLLRLTCEAYLLLDPCGATPSERWARIVAMQEAASHDAWAKGLADVHCWLPPRIARRFGRRLESLGWVRDDAWVPYCKKLSP